jgi:hypothetical protein
MASAFMMRPFLEENRNREKTISRRRKSNDDAGREGTRTGVRRSQRNPMRRWYLAAQNEILRYC